MKVLLTTPTFPPFNSGLGNVVAEQARQLAARGVEVVVATGGPARASQQAAAARVEMFPVSGSAFAADPIRGDVDGYRAFVAQERADVVVMHAWQTWSTDALLPQLEALPGRKVLWSHCLSVNGRLGYAPLKSTLRYLLWRPYWWSLPARMRKLDALVFLAEDGDDDRFDDIRLARKLGVTYRVIPNAAPEVAETLPPAARGAIIAVGSYTEAKGFDFVLEAYTRSSARNTVPLALYGQAKTPYFDELTRQAARLGIDPQFLTMHVGVAGAALSAAYRRATLFLSGSHTECQPLVLLEAMAAGVPFVARRTGCISSMPGGMAVDSPAEAARCVDSLRHDESRWLALSAGGRQAAAEMYNARLAGDRTMALLTELAG